MSHTLRDATPLTACLATLAALLGACEPLPAPPTSPPGPAVRPITVPTGLCPLPQDGVADPPISFSEGILLRAPGCAGSYREDGPQQLLFAAADGTAQTPAHELRRSVVIHAEGDVCVVDLDERAVDVKEDVAVPATAFPAHVTLCRAALVLAHADDVADDAALSWAEVGADAPVALPGLPRPMAAVTADDGGCDADAPSVDVADYAFHHVVRVKVPLAAWAKLQSATDPAALLLRFAVQRR